MAKKLVYPPIKVGAKFGRLEVVGDFVHRQRGGKSVRYWPCRCDCGAQKAVLGIGLKSGRTRSCGCLRDEKIAAVAEVFNKTHGRTRTREYAAWAALKNRCNCPTNKDFERYGGRGIKVCPEWGASFEAFLRDVGPRPSPRHTIDRKDVNGDYCPENCRWATQTVQQRNRRNNWLIEHAGARKTLSEWAGEAGISRPLLAWRIKNGWSMARALGPVTTK